MDDPIEDTTDSQYAERLLKQQRAWWKRVLGVQAPYRWHIRRLKPGFVLDVGCGIGRNLGHLNGRGIGIDHNEQSVKIARQLGLQAFTPEEFRASSYVHQQFDSLLLAHVAEHMTQPEVVRLLKSYLHHLKPDGRLIVICPQEAGYKSDSTHAEFMEFSKLGDIHRELGLTILKEYSFPFPRFMGRVFKYNEFVSISQKQ